MPRKARCSRGGNSLTALQIDPYYLKKMYGKGLLDWFKSKSKKEEEKLNAEILADIAKAKAELASRREKTTHASADMPKNPDLPPTKRKKRVIPTKNLNSQYSPQT